MPIVEVSKTGATLICLECGSERTIPFSQFVIVDPDGEQSHFSTKTGCPTCKAAGVESWETFIWHDDVEIVYDQHEIKVGETKDGQDVTRTEIIARADPDHPRAQLQASVAAIAAKIGAKQARRNQPRHGVEFVYPKKPKVPDPISVRNGVAIAMMKNGKRVLPNFLP